MVMLPSLTAAITECVLNSIDAGATRVQVSVDAPALSFEVADNGRGISAGDMRMLGERFATSKLGSVQQLAAVATHGFRGEAVASLARCSLLEVVSRAAGAPATLCKTFEGGKILSLGPATEPRGTGTTVKVRDLFYNFPARRSIVVSTVPLAVEKTKRALEAVALSYPAIGISVFNLRTDTRVLHTSKHDSVLATFSELFGGAKAGVLRPLPEHHNTKYHFSGYVHSPTAELYSTTDFQFFYVNNRSLTSCEFHRLLNKIYKAFQPQTRTYDRYPSFVICLECDPALYDVTVEPDKSRVLFSDEKTPLDILRCLVTVCIFGIETVDNGMSELAGLRDSNARTAPAPKMCGLLPVLPVTAYEPSPPQPPQLPPPSSSPLPPPTKRRKRCTSAPPAYSYEVRRVAVRPLSPPTRSAKRRVSFNLVDMPVPVFDTSGSGSDNLSDTEIGSGNEAAAAPCAVALPPQPQPLAHWRPHMLKALPQLAPACDVPATHNLQVTVSKEQLAAMRVLGQVDNKFIAARAENVL
eukprot:TRINITY_DN1577_c0_g1_i6.p1 TRINITY_DN1577_c0_g1~~TRINITY_DN1577_c0_g1_i6.p1  ORF type:complete len:548 (-),score=109.29 TRINITY_DN1577_c0_g1_i6:703-2277(-)